jgi:hypothetical protein
MASLLNPEPLTTAALLLNMLLALAASTIVAVFYAHWGEALTNRNKFARLIPMLSLLTVFVISIKLSVVVKLGVMSSLTLVRLRSANKDPEELLYLFFAVAIGFGFGADQRLATLIAVAIVLVLLAAKRLAAPRRKRCNLYVNIDAPGPADGDAAVFARVSAALGAQARSVGMRRLDHPKGALQMTYLLACRDQAAIAKVLSDLQAQVPNCSFSYADQRPLPES